MRTIRLAIAALIAMALAVLPVSAAFAMQSAQSASKAEASMSAPDDACPCCDAMHDPDATHDQAAAACAMKCCGVTAILVEAQLPARPRALSGADTAATWFAPFTLPPDPPPPRS